MSDNIFAGQDIYLPLKYQAYFHQYSLTRIDGANNDPEDSPFPRMIDMWFLAFCLAVKDGLDPTYEIAGEKYKAIEGVVLGSDGWRSNLIQIIVLTLTEEIELIISPREMLNIANAYAITGLPILINLLEERGPETALDFLCEELSIMIDDML